MKKSRIPHNSNLTIFIHTNFCAYTIFHIFFNHPRSKKGHQRLFVDILRFDFFKEIIFCLILRMFFDIKIQFLTFTTFHKYFRSHHP